MRKAEEQYYRLKREKDELERRLTAVNALPAGEASEADKQDAVLSLLEDEED
jgi:hypothetical protein